MLPHVAAGTVPRMGAKTIVLAVAALLAGAELTTRILGLADVPLYDATPILGYVAKANQQGKFLNNRWYINDRHMIDPRPFDPNAESVLVVGDSIVFGGNPFDQPQRVASLLQASSPERAVYAVAAGSWGLANELAYLRTNPDVPAHASRILFVLNEEDFGQPTGWRCESFNPTHPPLSHLYWIARKYLAPECLLQTPAALQPAHTDLAVELDRFLAQYGERVRFVIYPKADRLNVDFSPELRKLSPRVTAGQILNMTSKGTQARFGWSKSSYNDAIHPTIQGNVVLAQVLATLLPPGGAGGMDDEAAGK